VSRGVTNERFQPRFTLFRLAPPDDAKSPGYGKQIMVAAGDLPYTRPLRNPPALEQRLAERVG
jgi:hypothetical protein